MFKKICYEERQIETVGGEEKPGRRARMGESGSTSGGELGALAGAAVVVSVLGAEWGAGVGEAARPSRRAAKSLCMNAAPWE